MNQDGALRMILEAVGGLATLEMIFAAISVKYLNRKTEEKRQERLQREAKKDSNPMGHPPSNSFGMGVF
jgi:hypothetical protein